MKSKLINVTVFILLSFQLLAQKPKENISNEIIQIYNYSQNCYPVNDEIVNGCQYIFPSKKIKGNPFFYNYEWNKSIIFINNKAFSEFELKYDLVKNAIVIKVYLDGNIKKIIELNKFNVDSFVLESSKFINSNILLNNETKCTFYEQIFKGNISMYKTYNKRFINLYDDMSPNGKFSSIKSKIYILKEGAFFNVYNQYSFLHFFNIAYRKKIKGYMKNYNIKLNNASNNQLKGLMDYCNNLITK